MNLFDDFDFLSQGAKSDGDTAWNELVPETRSEQFSNDKAQAAAIKQQLTAVELLMQQIDVPQEIKDSLSISSTTFQTKRRAPSFTDKVRALWDYWAFIDLINFHGGALAFSECHYETTEWKYRPSAKFRQLILEARGMLKSTLYCVGYVLWRIYQNPNIRIFVGTESLKLSKAFIREIEAYLTDDWLKEFVWNARPHFQGPLIPEMDSLGKSRRSIIRDISAEFGEEYSTDNNASKQKKVWRAEAIQVVRTRNLKEPTLTAGSVGQTATGFHFDEEIFDDIHTFKNTQTENKIESVFSWVYDMESVLDPPYIDVELVNKFYTVAPNHFELLGRWAISGGRVTVLGTRYDELDYYGHVIDNAEALGFEVHERNIYVNGVDSSDGYRWPEKWNEQLERQTLAQFQTKLGSAGIARFASQYLNKIVTFESTILDWDKIQWIDPGSVVLDAETKFVTIYNRDGTVKAQFRPRLCLDPTTTSSKTSDFCAMCVGGVYENHTYVIDFWMKKALPEVWLAQMWFYIEKWNLFDAVIEMVGGFKVLEYTVKQMWLREPDKYRPLSIHPFSPPTNASEGKTQRIETILSPIVNNGLMHLPMYAASNQELRSQFTFFGKATAHDDGPDVIAMLQEKAYKLRPPIKKKETSNPNTPVVHPVHGGVVYGTFEDNRQRSYNDIESELNAA